MLERNAALFEHMSTKQVQQLVRLLDLALEGTAH
jgi:hypothetical protein